MKYGRRFSDESYPDDYDYYDQGREPELNLAVTGGEYMEEPDYRDIIRQLTLQSLRNG